MLSSLVWTLLAEDAPEVPLPVGDLTKYAIIAGGVVAGFLLVGLLLRRGKKKPLGPDAGLMENLGAYPAPPKAGRRRLLLQGQPMRLRLVVIAPVGKKKFAEGGEVEPVLDDVVPGLGDIAIIDKPRVRIWPPQLSIPGFPLSFYRKTDKPASQEFNWVLVSGLARAEGQAILLGLALWSDKPTKKGQVVLEPNGWSEALRVE